MREGRMTEYSDWDMVEDMAISFDETGESWSSWEMDFASSLIEQRAGLSRHAYTLTDRQREKVEELIERYG